MKSNKQSVEKVKKDDKGEFIDWVDCWRTIQGEGPFSGCPAVFVRLAGCTLQCPFCDADYTTGRRFSTIKDLSQIISEKRERNDILVITGGEPFRQNITPFLTYLQKCLPSLKIQIETNGTVCRFVPDSIEVVCSPKTKAIDHLTKTYVTAWKYVVAEGKISGFDGLPTNSLGMSQKVARPTNGAPVYIQPEDTGDPEQNQRNLMTAAAVCMKHSYRLCVQVQKLIDYE